MGVGIADGFSRIGSIICPFLIIPLLKIDIYSSFLVLAFVSLANILFVWLHPIDLTNKALDDINNRKK
jgi:hypothetical protein